MFFKYVFLLVGSYKNEFDFNFLVTSAKPLEHIGLDSSDVCLSKDRKIILKELCKRILPKSFYIKREKDLLFLFLFF